MFSLSNTSLEKMNGVHPNVVNFIKELIKESPYDFKITCGVRTAEEQNREYQKGRSILYDSNGNKQPKVSWCDGYILKSKHQVKIDGYGYAVDIAVLEREKYTDKKTGEEKEKTVARWDYKYYKAIYDVAKSKGLIDKYNIVWGGNWKQKDSVHFQLGTADNVQFRRYGGIKWKYLNLKQCQ